MTPMPNMHRPALPIGSARRTMLAARTFAAATFVALLPAALAAQNRPYPTTPPPAAPVEPAEFPPFREARLSNGLRIVVVEQHDHPVISLSLAFDAGEAYTPAGKEGLSNLLASVLTKGAGTRSAEEIAELIEGAGGAIGASAGADFFTVYVSMLAPQAAQAFELLGDVVVRPTLPESEIELQRQQTLSGLRLAQGQPGALASRAFFSRVYGSHPYARQATPTSVQSIARSDLVDYRDARLRPEGALLVVAGDITLAEVQRMAEEAFRGWTGAPAAAPARAAPPAERSSAITLVHRPGSVQSTIMVGNTTFGPRDSLYYPAVVANRILGEGAEGRLFAILREQKGWTYGAYSSFARRRDVGFLAAQADVRTAVTDSALVEMVSQLRRIGAEPVDTTELERAKNALVGSFPLSIETAAQVANAVTTARLYGLPDDYLRTYRTRLAAVTPQQVREAANRIARPDDAVIVVVGDGAEIYDDLQRIGPVTIVSAQGDTLSPTDLTGATAALRPDPARLVARRDSFAVMVQGNALGGMVRETVREADGWLLRDISTIPAAGLSQTTEIRLTDSLALRSVSQRGSAQGQEMRIDVTVADGRATGSSRTPTPQGMRDTTVDVVIPAGAIDDNAVPTLVAAMPLPATGSFSVPVFASGQGTVRNVTHVVGGRESITVPAGTFDVIRVDGEGAQPVTYWVTAAAPYRVVKLALNGGAIEVVLVK